MAQIVFVQKDFSHNKDHVLTVQNQYQVVLIAIWMVHNVYNVIKAVILDLTKAKKSAIVLMDIF